MPVVRHDELAVLAPEAVEPARPRVVPLGTGGGCAEPTYGDLVGLPADDDEAERELLRRCVVGTPTRDRARRSRLVDDSLAGPLAIACAACGEPVEAP